MPHKEVRLVVDETLKRRKDKTGRTWGEALERGVKEFESDIVRAKNVAKGLQERTSRAA
jgi:hypothetical protein